jgi:hypothetical protein
MPVAEDSELPGPSDRPPARRRLSPSARPGPSRLSESVTPVFRVPVRYGVSGGTPRLRVRLAAARSRDSDASPAAQRPPAGPGSLSPATVTVTVGLAFQVHWQLEVQVRAASESAVARARPTRARSRLPCGRDARGPTSEMSRIGTRSFHDSGRATDKMKMRSAVFGLSAVAYATAFTPSAFLPIAHHRKAFLSNPAIQTYRPSINLRMMATEPADRSAWVAPSHPVRPRHPEHFEALSLS